MRPSIYVPNPNSVVGAKIESKEIINNLQVTKYSNGFTTVRSGETTKGTLLFMSEVYDAARTFAVVFTELIPRKFVTKDKKEHAAFFSRQFPTYLFGTENYDHFRNTFVRFVEPLEGEPLGYLKIK